MKKKILLIIMVFTFYTEGNCQITKGNWMVGGNANFVFTNTGGNNVTKTTTINIAPNIGYFFIDKFAGGLRLSFYKNTIKFFGPTNNNNFTTFTIYSVGPFIRYYFLPVDKPYNILSEVNYQFSNEKIKTNNPSTSNDNTNSFSLSAGPVIYFNSSVGIEFLLTYSNSGNNLNSSRGNSFGVGIGLQFHLEKDKNL